MSVMSVSGFPLEVVLLVFKESLQRFLSFLFVCLLCGFAFLFCLTFSVTVLPFLFRSEVCQDLIWDVVWGRHPDSMT